jgi:hypothetical protein
MFKTADEDVHLEVLFEVLDNESESKFKVDGQPQLTR